MAEPPAAGDRAQLVARYKQYLRDCIDRRPSGLRGRLALALAKHKSFVSQITNPGYSVPIPAGDVPTILEVCHLSSDERHAFLGLYAAAHPRRASGAATAGTAAHRIHIDLPAFDDAALAVDVEVAIRELAQRIIRLAQHRPLPDGADPRPRPARRSRLTVKPGTTSEP